MLVQRVEENVGIAHRLTPYGYPPILDALIDQVGEPPVTAAYQRFLSELGAENENTIELDVTLADYAADQLQFAQAATRYQRVFSWLQEHMGDRHLAALSTARKLAWATIHSGRVEAGTVILQQAIEQLEAGDEQNDEIYFRASHSLADALHESRQYRAAADTRKALLKQLSMHTDFGETAPLTLQVLEALAGDLEQAGDFEGAIEIRQQALARWEEVKGPKSEPAFTAKIRWAATLRQAGRLPESLQLLRDLEAHLQVQAAQSPALVETRSALMLAEHLAGKRENEISVARRNAESQQGQPQEHQALMALAMALIRQGDVAEGIAACEQAAKIIDSRQSQDDPDTWADNLSLAQTLRMARQYDRALRLCQSVLKSRQAHFGEDHLLTLATLEELAEGQLAAGDFASGLSTRQRAWDRCVEVCGEDNLHSWDALSRLADAHLIMGHTAVAVEMQRGLLAKRRERFGEAHPDVCQTLNRLADALAQAQQYDEAIDITRQLLEQEKSVYGEQHFQTLETHRGLARLLEAGEQFSAAMELRQQVLEIIRQEHGAEHEFTLQDTASLAGSYLSAGEWGPALSLYVEAYKKQRNLLGASHTQTLASLYGIASCQLRKEDYARAQRSSFELVKLHKQTNYDEPVDEARAIALLAEAALAMKKSDDAIRIVENAIPILEQYSSPPERYLLFHAQAVLGQAVWAQGDVDAAKTTLQSAVDQLRDFPFPIPIASRYRTQRAQQARSRSRADLDSKLRKQHSAMTDSAHILLCPVGSAGDVYPYIGLGVALQNRGHRVTMLTSGYFQETAERVGLEFIDTLPQEEFLKLVANPLLWDPLRGTKTILETFSVELIRQAYDAVAACYVPGETVAVSSCIGFGSRIAQEYLGLPLVTAHLQPVVFWSLIETPRLHGIAHGPWAPTWLKRLQYWVGETFVLDPMIAPQINAVRAELGLTTIVRKVTRWWHSPQCILGMFPAWYAPPQADWPPQTQLTQFPLWNEQADEPLPAELAEFLEAGEPPIVFTPGSANMFGQAFFAAAAEACQTLGRRGIFFTKFPEQVPAKLPDSIRCFAYAPFKTLLPRVAAISHHGGIGTTAQAMSAGIPQLIMPLAHDQPDNAARLKKLGIGDELSPKRYRHPELTRRLARLLDNAQVRVACQKVARRFEGVDPYQASCEVVESLIGQDQRVRMSPD